MPCHKESSAALSVGALGNRFGAPGAAELEVLPQHFLLHPGEQIHYTVCSEGSKPRCPDAKFAITDFKIVRMIEPKGILEVVTPGRTELVVQTPKLRRQSDESPSRWRVPLSRSCWRSLTVPSRRSRRRTVCSSSGMPTSMGSIILPSPSPELTVLYKRPRRMAGR